MHNPHADKAHVDTARRRSLTLQQIADMVGRAERTVRGWPSRYPDFPPVGRRTADAVRAWLQAHPRVAGPPPRPLPVDRDPQMRVSLYRYDQLTGRADGTTAQYRRRAEKAGWPEPGHPDWFPRPGPDGRWRLQDLIDWDRSRPGQGARRTWHRPG